MENEVKKTSKIWIIPTIIAAILLVALIVFMVIMGKGTTAVADGTQTLAESVAPLKDGTAQLSEGVDQYTEGVDQVADGVEMLNDNVPTLSDGVQQLADGAVALNKGVNVGSGSLAVGVKTLYDNGTKLADGLIGMLDSLAANRDKYVADATKAAGVQYDLTNDAATTGPAHVTAQNKVSGAVGNVSTKLAVYTTVMDLTGMQAAAEFITANPSYSTLQADITALCTVGGKGITMSADNTTYLANKDNIKAAIVGKREDIKAMVGSQGYTGEALDAATEQTINNTTEGLYGVLNTHVTNTNANGLQGVKAMQEYQAALQSVTPAVTDLCTFYGSHGAAQALATVRTQMLNGGITYDSMNVLKKGVSDLNKGVNGKGGLAEGVKQLQAGTAQLNEGVPTLSDGVKQLYDGTQQLKDNSDALRDGAKTLKDSAPALIDGIGQLVDGAKQVKGMVPGN